MSVETSTWPEIPCDKDSIVSIHSDSAINFYESVLNADPWVLRVLSEGLLLPFKMVPKNYREKNNMSALNNMSVVRDIVFDWEKVGIVERLNYVPTCVNPLTLVSKTDVETGLVKNRLVIDQSRYVNKLIDAKHTKLNDLRHSEPWLRVDMYQTSFDLKDMFHHVKLHPSMTEFFGFEIVMEDGSTCCFKFKFLQYGNSFAVFAVTKLLKPILAYLHNLSIKCSIFIDDGRLLHMDCEYLRKTTQFTLKVLHRAGWTVNKRKSHLIPTQQLFYLGFFTDTVNMRYYSNIKKIELILGAIDRVLCENIVAKLEFAQLLGRISSRRTSHGPIVNIVTRHCQHLLGMSVHSQGEQDWNGYLSLDDNACRELRFLKDHLVTLNGFPIKRSKTPLKVIGLNEQRYISDTIPDDECANVHYFCSDASETHSFLYEMEKFSVVENVEFTQSESKQSSGFRELLAICKFIELYKPSHMNERNVIYWFTDSQNLLFFLKKGSRKWRIQEKVLDIKMYEQKNNISFIPVWVPREDDFLVLADAGSKLNLSTDEWTISNRDFAFVVQYFQLKPSVDCFATAENKKCDKFFSKIPQKSVTGIDFFAQKLISSEVYWACPPASLVLDVFKHIRSFENVTVLLFLPVWKASNFWPVIKENDNFHPLVSRFLLFSPEFVAGNEASNLFSGQKKFQSIVLLLNTAHCKNAVKCPIR